MQNCGCQTPSLHSNAFVDLNGIPYLLAEYLDKRNFQQIDRSLIRSEIFIDQSESMRAIIDINIDDIGKRASDGLPAITGNNTKQNNLLRMIDNNAVQMDHQLEVLRRGLILRVNYQLENHRSKRLIRSMCEDFRVLDRNFFLDINPRNVNDNAIIVNFNTTAVSTVNEFTHGVDRMVLRITNVQLFYERLKKGPKMPRVKQSLCSYQQPEMALTCGYGDIDTYQYHERMQNQHVMGMPGCDNGGYGNEDVSMISPPTWAMFDRYYHFDNRGSDIVLHGSEINDPMSPVALVPCGNVRVNRAFVINPGHRLIFKFSVWKNDLTVVNDTSPIAQALKAPLMDACCDNVDNGCYGTTTELPPTQHVHGHNPMPPEINMIMRMVNEGRRADATQNHAINRLIDCVKSLQDTVDALQNPDGSDLEDPPEVTEPEDPVDPPVTEDPTCGCGCDCSHIEAISLDKIEAMVDRISNKE